VEDDGVAVGILDETYVADPGVDHAHDFGAGRTNNVDGVTVTDLQGLDAHQGVEPSENGA
jgi:hypothetical protein